MPSSMEGIPRGALKAVALKILPWVGWLLALLMAVLRYVEQNPPPT